MGGYDLYAAKGNETQWKAPENLGYPINSSRDDIYFSVQQNNSLFTNAIFTSDRGAECCLATYTVIKTPKKKLSKGIVLDCNNNLPLGDVDVVMTDASGKKMKTVTNKDGDYLFELMVDAPIGMISAYKEKYKEQSTGITIQRIDETAWHTDTFYTAAICMEKKLVIKVENVVTVYFDFDRSLVKERGMSQLDSIYTILMENPVATLQVSGYTDGLGSEEYNKILSDKRAKACADYLIQKGIDAARISFESFGACCPVEMELINGRDNPDGRSMNRRALINITKE
jgi:outer membrane protein OmpA-like peptidoglycan-associated protein